MTNLKNWAIQFLGAQFSLKEVFCLNLKEKLFKSNFYLIFAWDSLRLSMSSVNVGEPKDLI